LNIFWNHFLDNQWQPYAHPGIAHNPDVSLDMLDIVLQNPSSCLSHAILAPTNQQVDHYNDVILQCVHCNQHVYLAADTLKEANNTGLISPDSALDYAAHQTPPGLLSHTLTV
jgi:hypothetical protein